MFRLMDLLKPFEVPLPQPMETQRKSMLVVQQLGLILSRVNNNKTVTSALKHALACCVSALSCNIARCTLSPPITRAVGHCSVLVACRGPGLSCPVSPLRVYCFGLA